MRIYLLLTLKDLTELLSFIYNMYTVKLNKSVNWVPADRSMNTMLFTIREMEAGPLKGEINCQKGKYASHF